MPIRPEVTGRKAGNVSAIAEAIAEPQSFDIAKFCSAIAEAITGQQAFTITEFCARNEIGLSTFHKLKSQGRGPRIMYLGRAVRIGIEAERDWRAERERPEGAEAKLIARETKARVTAGRRAGSLAAQSSRHVSKRKRSA
jgi:hypothetical protein